MPENDPTPKDSIFVALDWARGKAEPYLTWLPEGIEPYAVDAVAILVLAVALVGIWKSGADLWRRAIWAPRALWRLATGYEPPESETKIAGEAAKRAEEAALRTEQKVEDALRALFTAQAEKTEESGAKLPEDAIDRAVAAAQEVLLSNDPSKAAAQEALRKKNFQAAEDALEKAISVANAQGALSWQLRAATDLVRLRDDQGDAAPARATMKAVYDQFVEGFASPDLIDAKALEHVLS